MKFRTDFVTNSSSSSFVIIGYVLPKKRHSRIDVLRSLFAEKIKEIEDQCGGDKDKLEDEILDMWYDAGHDPSLFLADHPEKGAPDKEHYLIGILIAEFDDADPPSAASYTLEEVNKKTEKLKLAFDLKGEPMIYVGTRLC